MANENNFKEESVYITPMLLSMSYYRERSSFDATQNKKFIC